MALALLIPAPKKHTRCVRLEHASKNKHRSNVSHKVENGGRGHLFSCALFITGTIQGAKGGNVNVGCAHQSTQEHCAAVSRYLYDWETKSWGPEAGS